MNKTNRNEIKKNIIEKNLNNNEEIKQIRNAELNYK
jgi:hypothetical protein